MRALCYSIGLGALTLSVGALVFNSASAKAPLNPIGGNSGFTVVVESDARLAGNKNEGTLAVGGNLTLDGNYHIANGGVGTFIVPGDAQPTALVVGGRVDFAQSSPSGRLTVLSNGYAKVGDLANASVLETDGNGASVNTRLNATGDYETSLRIGLTARQPVSSVGSASIFDFARLFATYRERAASLARCPSTVTLRDGNGLPFPGGVIPPGSAVRIGLTSGVTNVIQITAANLSNIAKLVFDNQPTTTSPLMIVVDTTAVGGDYVWAAPGFSGIGGPQARFVLLNFPDATTITLPAGAGATVEGTIFAPAASLVDENSSAIEGNVIVRELTHGTAANRGGEMHNFQFGAELDCTDPALTPTPTPTPTPLPVPPPSPTPEPGVQGSSCSKTAESPMVGCQGKRGKAVADRAGRCHRKHWKSVEGRHPDRSSKRCKR
jgi:choice-of-anchor A domain-containing protein